MEKIKELKEKRAKIIADQRAIQDKADKEERSLTADELTSWENMDVEFNSLTDEINEAVKEHEAKQKEEIRKQQLDEREKLLKKTSNAPIKPNVDEPDPDTRSQGPKFVEYEIRNKYKRLQAQFRKEKSHLSTVDYMNSAISVLCGNSRAILGDETRALQADSDAAGGYLVAPEQMVFTVIETLDDMVFMRGLATVYSLPNAVSLGAPVREVDMDDIDWTGEITSTVRDTGLTFGKRDLYPHPLSKEIQVSKKLVRVSQINIPDYIARAFGRKMGYVEENAFLNGSGVNQPLGIFTSSDSGISASRNVSAGNTTSAITADGLVNCVMNLRKQYRTRPSVRWVFHRDAVKMIRKLKDGEGQYLWRMGLTESEPDRILGYPYEESEYAPNTFTTGLNVGIIGDMSFYWIADSLAMEGLLILWLWKFKFYWNFMLEQVRMVIFAGKKLMVHLCSRMLFRE